jgi:hypothetical protein
MTPLFVAVIADDYRDQRLLALPSAHSVSSEQLSPARPLRVHRDHHTAAHHERRSGRKGQI